MSAKYTFLAWDTPISNAHLKLALLQLANNSDDNGFSYYSISKMAKACGMSERNFIRKISELEEMKMLKVERRANRTSQYTLIGDEMGVTLCQLQRSGVTECHVGVTECHAEGDRVSHDPNSTPNTYPDTSLVQAKPKRSKFKFSDDDLRFAKEMFKRVIVINPAAKEPNFDNWANTIRLMREVDKRYHSSMWAAFDWANKDSFWCSNILSPEKLRKQFDKLQVKINETNKPRNVGSGRKLNAVEENNARLLEKYGNPSAHSERTINSDEHTGLGQREIPRSIPSQVDSSGITIDMDSGDIGDDSGADQDFCF